MTSGIATVIYPVNDLARAKAFYTTFLGVEPYVDSPYYVGFNVGGQDIALDPRGHSKGMIGPIAYAHVSDIQERFMLLLDAGAEVVQAISDVGGGKLIASVKDADGNIVGLLQPA